ncbi:MAG: c-type cytochrome biogenesis protein CcsB [Desulfosalsimonadaceae bacterium]
MITSSGIFSIITFIYGLAVVFYVISWVFKKDNLPVKLASAASIAAISGNFAGIILRWVESYQMGHGHAPLSNLYESLVFFSLCTASLYLYLQFRYKLRIVGLVASPIAFLSMAYASLVNSSIEPLIPALQSNWLIAHVITCFIGYAGFAVAFGISILYFIKAGSKKPGREMTDKIPHIDMLDELTHQMVMFGFLFLSAGIITGAVWANQAWGRYWGWDPKETWSLITWFIYASLLHARLMRGWTGRRIAVLSCAGFIAVIFTYFGVNLLPGLHSYQ